MHTEAHSTDPIQAPVAPDSGYASAVTWALFDIGYTTFATLIFARYLATWFINDLHQPSLLFGAAQLTTAALLLIGLPIFGALADASGRGPWLLGVFAGLAGVSAIALGNLPHGAPIALVLAIAIMMTLGVGLSFGQFEPLLARAARPQKWGFLSGIAVSLGLLSAIIALAPFNALVTSGADDKQRVFMPLGVLLLAATVPLVLVMGRHAKGATDTRARAALGQGIGKLRDARRTIREQPSVARFLLAHFLYTDAIGTVPVYIAVYLTYIGGSSETTTSALAALGLAFAAAGAALASLWVDRVGPRKLLRLVLPLCTAALTLTAATGTTWSVWVVLPAIGLTLGTIYTADRVFLLRLTPPELRGEMFGFFNVVGRAAQALAPLILWGAVSALLHGTGLTSQLTAARISMLLLGLTALAGWYTLGPLSDAPRDDFAADADADADSEPAKAT
ncbi:MAG: MFS transporter [Thermoleophilia bacterium]|nr:MFS transporter [Thermoleophilia bacterium]